MIRLRTWKPRQICKPASVKDKCSSAIIAVKRFQTITKEEVILFLSREVQKKPLMTHPTGNSEFCFPLTLNVPGGDRGLGETKLGSVIRDFKIYYGDVDESFTSKCKVLCTILRLSRLFRLVHFMQCGRITLKLNLHEQFRSKNTEWKICICTLPFTMLLCRIQQQNACSTIIFPFLTNGIIAFWRCRFFIFFFFFCWKVITRPRWNFMQCKKYIL